MIRKAIIPVAGWGTRRLPITKVVEKAMLPVGNRPIVDYVVQELIAAGVTEIYMVVSSGEKCQVRDFYEKNVALERYLVEHGKEDKLDELETLPEGVKMYFVEQDTLGKYGTAVPVALTVSKYAINEPVFVYMGDDFIWNPGGESAAESLAKAAGESNSAIMAVEMPQEKVEKYGALMVEGDNLAGIVEKPSIEEAPSNLINVSKYVMAPELLQKIVKYVEENDFGAGGLEYKITEPILEYINNGGVMRVARTSGEYLDGGSMEGWLNANNVVCKN